MNSNLSKAACNFPMRTVWCVLICLIGLSLWAGFTYRNDRKLFSSEGADLFLVTATVIPEPGQYVLEVKLANQSWQSLQVNAAANPFPGIVTVCNEGKKFTFHHRSNMGERLVATLDPEVTRLNEGEGLMWRMSSSEFLCLEDSSVDLDDLLRRRPKCMVELRKLVAHPRFHRSHEGMHAVSAEFSFRELPDSQIAK